MYPDVQLFIDGEWTAAKGGRTMPVENPATGEDAGTVAHADTSDLDRALEAAQRAFIEWRAVSPYDKAKILKKAADLLRERADKGFLIERVFAGLAEGRRRHRRHLSPTLSAYRTSAWSGKEWC